MPPTLGELADRFGCDLRGDAERRVTCVGTLNSAGADAVAFLANPKFRAQLADTRAAAVVLTAEAAPQSPTTCLIHPNPYATFARIATFLHPRRTAVPGLDSSASVAADARVASSASIGPHAVVAARAQLGERVSIGAGAFVGEASVIGADSAIAPRVVIMDGVTVGQRCIIHSGAVIGADGFGFAPDDGRWVKVPQIGGVVIGDDVEIGANTSIDRGTIDDTVIGAGVKLDNLVQIAHNVRIGEHTVMAAMSGVAGSSTVGKRCMIGGGAVVINHVSICDDVMILFRSVVTKSINEPGTYSGVLPAELAASWRRRVARFRQLEDLAERLQRLESKLAGLIAQRKNLESDGS